PTRLTRALKKTSHVQRAVRDRCSLTAPSLAASNTIPRVHSNGGETRQCVRVESQCPPHASVRQTSQTDRNTQSGRSKDDKPESCARNHGPPPNHPAAQRT